MKTAKQIREMDLDKDFYDRYYWSIKRNIREFEYEILKARRNNENFISINKWDEKLTEYSDPYNTNPLKNAYLFERGWNIAKPIYEKYGYEVEISENKAIISWEDKAFTVDQKLNKILEQLIGITQDAESKAETYSIPPNRKYLPEIIVFIMIIVAFFSLYWAV